jgi:hypothetical protein
MTLVIVTVVIIALLIAALAVYLFMIGELLGHTSTGLKDCLRSIRTIAGQAQVIGPGMNRINKTATDLIGAMPLLIEGANEVAAKLAPSTVTTPAPAAPVAPASAAHTSAPVGTAADTPSGAAGAHAMPSGKGYLDDRDNMATGSVGYLDV